MERNLLKWFVFCHEKLEKKLRSVSIKVFEAYKVVIAIDSSSFNVLPIQSYLGSGLYMLIKLKSSQILLGTVP